MREEADLGSSAAVMKLHRTSSFWGKVMGMNGLFKHEEKKKLQNEAFKSLKKKDRISSVSQ